MVLKRGHRAGVVRQPKTTLQILEIFICCLSSLYYSIYCFRRQVHDRMLAHLAQCDFAVAKARLTSSMSTKELKNYENWSKKIELDISSAKENIEKKKSELSNARTVRRNRIEYDLLAKVISEQPDRRKTNDELAQLKDDLKSLQVLILLSL